MTRVVVVAAVANIDEIRKGHPAVTAAAACAGLQDKIATRSSEVAAAMAWVQRESHGDRLSFGTALGPQAHRSKGS